MNIKLISSALVASLLTFTGCGGGDDSSIQTQTTTSTVQGQLIDSAVSGVTYKCSSGGSDMTDVSGHFTCKVGDSVEFSINGFVLGSAKAGEFITPQTLFPNNTQAQANLAQLLQTLDSDGNPENGITIDPQSQEAQGLNANLTVDFSQLDFDSVMTSYIGKTLVDEVNATAHLNLSLQNLANGAGTVTGYSVVAIVNNAADSSCHRDVEATYDGFADYEAFINAGGSLNVEYLEATAKQCSQYSAAGYCIEQTIPIGVNGSGNGSCVMVVTFPDSVILPDNNTTDTNTSNTVDENPTVNPDEISYEDFTTNYAPFTNLRSDNIYISAYESYVGNTPEYTAINSLYNSIDAQAINFGVYYTIGGGNYLYEITKTTVTINQNNPYTSEVTLQKEYVDSDGLVQDLGTKTYTEINNLLAGNGTEIKFSKSLATPALQQIYSDYGMDISFDTNDRAWFMFRKWSNTDFELVMNESAYLKVKAAFQAKIAAAGN